jgi:hypothetical protein
MRFTDSQRRRLWLAVLVSLLAHMLLLPLVFSGQGFGVPGLGLKPPDRRADTGQVRVQMLPPRAHTAPPAVNPSPSTHPAPLEKAATVAAPAAPPSPQPERLPPAASIPAPPPPAPLAETTPSTPPVEATSRLGTLEPGTVTAARRPAADLLTVDRPDPRAWAVPATSAVAMIDITPATATATATAPATTASSPQRSLPAPRPASASALARIDTLPTERAVDLATLSGSAQLAQRQADQLQAQWAELARAQAQAQAEREQAAREAAAQQDAARALAAQQAAADNARREASRQAMGRQLDEEAARRRESEAATARQATTLPLSWSNPRRGRLLGRTDANNELVLYAEAWARKIQLNMTFDQVREAVKQRHANPLVTVALRQDGSVEAVTFVVSSGVPQIDEAIRRIVQDQAPYPAFPPALARDFDVIEVRRTWSFDMAIRLY